MVDSRVVLGMLAFVSMSFTLQVVMAGDSIEKVVPEPDFDTQTEDEGLIDTLTGVASNVVEIFRYTGAWIVFVLKLSTFTLVPNLPLVFRFPLSVTTLGTLGFLFVFTIMRAVEGGSQLIQALPGF